MRIQKFEHAWLYVNSDIKGQKSFIVHVILTWKDKKRTGICRFILLYS